jgi:hypothetical protein
MKLGNIILILFFVTFQAKADLPFLPLKFSLEIRSYDYNEGEQIHLDLVIKNADETRTHSIIIPNDQENLSRLLKVKIYDNDLQAYIVRYETKVANDFNEYGLSLQILVPNQEIRIPITLLDTSEIESSISLNVPLFAGKYKFQVEYYPKIMEVFKSAFYFIEEFDGEISDESQSSNKTPILSTSVTNFIDLTIVRNESSQVKIGKEQFFIHFDKESQRYFYYRTPRNEIVSDTNLIHLTNLKPGQAENANEYLYNHFSPVFAEAIMRFPNGKIREYRKFKDTCPIVLKKMEFNENGQLITFSYQDEDSYYITKSNFKGFGNEYVYHYNLKTKKVQINTSGYDQNGKLLWSKQEFIDEDPCISIQLQKF